MTYDLIIPIYNIEDHLDGCLDSILCQTHGDFRALMVDDGSTDQSPLIAQGYAARDPRFIYYRKENGGLSDARNFGLAKVSSPYLLFVDGDDRLQADTLETVEREIDKAPVDILEFNGWIVKNGRRCSSVNTRPLDAGIVKNGRDYLLDNVKNRSLITQVWTKAIRSRLILQHRHLFAKGLLHEDELWTPKLYILADTVRYVNKHLYDYIQREGSITHQKDRSKNARDIKKIYYRSERYYKSLGFTKHQYNILASHLSRQMIRACRISEKEKMTPRDRRFIIRNARNLKSVGKMLLYLTAPRHYPVLSEKVKKIVRYNASTPSSQRSYRNEDSL